MQQGPRCRDDSIAMLNRELDMVREGPVVGNLFILISVRHNEQRGVRRRAQSGKRARVLCQLQADHRVHTVSIICTPVWNFKE